MVLRSDFNFPFGTSTPISEFFAVDVETGHSKKILFFLAHFDLINGTIKLFELFFLIFLKTEDLQLLTLHHLVLFFS